MKVLFVSSGNSGKISPIIKNQGESLVKEGVDVGYFTIKGKGVLGYLKNIVPLKKFLKEDRCDVVHAHYSLSAFVTSLAGVKNLCVSLMGTDLKLSKCYKNIIKLFAFIFHWKCIIVKSKDMYDDLGIKNAIIIPNGVDTERFRPLDKVECQKRLKWDSNIKHILFTSNPDRPEKNFQLALDSVNLIKDYDVELHFMKNVPNEETPIWYNAADVVLLTSLWEGSPNAIKEAMACNRPIVSTNVGDVKWIIGDTEGCYITAFNKEECSKKIIKEAINNNITKGETNGRQRIIDLGLSSDTVAKNIIKIYDKIKK